MSFEGQRPLTTEQPIREFASSSSEDVAIRVRGLSKCYHLYDRPQDRLRQSIYPRFQRMLGRIPRQYAREFWALKDISFEVKKGETVGIIGRNGSGKSTLLQIVAGTLEPTAGEVTVHGRVAALLELGSGFNPEFTGRENVYINAAIQGLSASETDAKFEDIAAFADIGEFIDQPVKIYSSGMYVRLAFAVQVAVEPDVLIVDEALAVGDMRFSMKCIRRMRELVDKGTACIFVSHDMSSIVNFCNEAMWFDNGMIVQKGSPKTVTMNYGNFMTYGLSPPTSSISFKAAAGVDTSRVESNEFLKSMPTSGFIDWIDVSSFPATGEGAARIERMAIHNSKTGSSGLHFSGGEPLEIALEVITKGHLRSPIIATDVRDARGNLIFGLNTYFLEGKMLELFPASRIRVRFSFHMPLLLNGKYSFSAAIADGSYEQHTQHHVINEAILFEVTSFDLPRRHYLLSLESACFDVERVSVERVS